MKIKSGATIAVWFSCGAASAVAARETIRQYPKANIKIVNCYVKEEDEDNRRFLSEVSEWLDRPIEVLVSSRFPSGSCVEVWDSENFMAGMYGAPCTLELKKKVRYEWEEVNKPDWHVLGFTSDESNRYWDFCFSERANTIGVLIDAGITKGDCYDIIRAGGLTLPKAYRDGYPNANCIGCVKASSPTYWNHVRRMNPEVFQERSEQSRRIGKRLTRVNGKRIFLDELKISDTGKPLKNMDFECGVFCKAEKRT